MLILLALVHTMFYAKGFTASMTTVRLKVEVDLPDFRENLSYGSTQSGNIRVK